MKKATKLLIAVLLLGLMPGSMTAQDRRDDSRYLAGAIPEVEGKVVFNKEFSIPGMPKEDIYLRIHTWLKAHMENNKNTSRIVFTNKEKGQIVAIGDEWIIFTSNSISLDRTRIIYQLTATCEAEKCDLEIAKIRYIYREGEERYTAEEWVTDKYALTKDKSKMIRGLAKWRRKTVDFIDGLTQEAADALSAANIENIAEAFVPEEKKQKEEPKVGPIVIGQKKEVAEATPKTVVTAVAPQMVTAPKVEVAAAPVAAQPAQQPAQQAVPTLQETTVPLTAAPAAATLPGYKQVVPAELPTNIIQMGAGKLVIVIGKDAFNMSMMTANAGGSLGKMNGKSVVFSMLSPDQPYQQMEQADNYVVRFYPAGQDQPSVILECKKLPSQTPLEGQPRMYIGEIINAFLKN
ncbi:MAG: DUF4468 domain-containing protein [Mediterranea massiliensis]|nr:DUF4468 domain-containing protein [Mediterranea massiliensis]